MSDALLAPEVTIWTDADHAGLVGDVLDLMGGAVRPLAVGGPRTAAVDGLARRLDCACHDDLRKMLVDQPAAFLLAANIEGLTAADVATAMEQGTMLLAMEPVVEGEELSVLRNHRGVKSGTLPGRVVHVPSFLRAEGWTGAAEPVEALGTVRLLSFQTLGGRGDGSLLSRLFDAWETLLHVAAMPETVCASLTSDASDTAYVPRGATGYLSVMGVTPQGASLVLQASDRAARNHRAMAVVAEKGELRVGQTGYQLLGPSGQELDRKDEAGSPPTTADAIAGHWRQLLDRPGLTSGESGTLDGMARVLACCQACLLSCRTGQPESPQRLLELR